jgi:hypothetical protein
MTSRPSLRTATLYVVLVLAAVALIASSAVEPLFSRVAEAQDQTVTVVQDPLLPGVETSDSSDGAAAMSELAPGTPAAPALASDIANVPEVPGGGTTTASLGGSDVAVASVGGSYQVDAPHKKKRRSPPPVPQP